jgi:hypothetical protein
VEGNICGVDIRHANGMMPIVPLELTPFVSCCFLFNSRSITDVIPMLGTLLRIGANLDDDEHFYREEMNDYLKLLLN